MNKVFLLILLLHMVIFNILIIIESLKLKVTNLFNDCVDVYNLIIKNTL